MSSSSVYNASETTTALGASDAAAPWNNYDENRQLRRCALALYFPLHAVEMGRFRDEWKSACEQNVRLLDVAFNRQLAGMVMNAAAYTSSVPVLNEENLIMYANRSSMDKKITFSVSNTPIVSYDQLDYFESYYGRKVFPRPLPHEEDVLVNGRPIVAPILFIFPTSLIPTVAGFNHLSEMPRRSALLSLLRTPSQRIAISDGPVTIIPTNARGFLVWVKALNRTINDNTPFTMWLSAASVEIGTMLHATLANRTSDQGVFVEVIHPTGDLIHSTVPKNDTTSAALHSSWLFTIPVLTQQWMCKCWAASWFRDRVVTHWPSVVGAVTALVFLLAAEVARRSVMRHYMSRRLLLQYQTQNRLLSTLSRYSKAIIEALPDSLLVVNAHGRILGINKAVLDVTGYSVAELEAMPITEIVFPMVLDLRFRKPSLLADSTEPTSPPGRDASVPASAPPPSPVPPLLRTPAPLPRQRSTGATADPLLAAGVFEGTVRRSDGSTLLASIAVNTTTGIEDRRAMLEHAFSAGVTPLISHQRRLLDDEIAQVVLFHDISDQIQAQRMAGAARFDEREATKSKNALLQCLAQALLPLTLGVRDALARVQHQMRKVTFGPVALRDRQLSADSVTGATLPPVIHARISSRTAAEDIDAAAATAQHMVVLMEDLALLIGTPLYGMGQDEPSAGVPLHQLQADALRVHDERIAAKHMRVTATVDPPSAVLGGHLATLRVLMTKILDLSSSIAMPEAAWDIKYTITRADRAAACSPSLESTVSVNSTGSHTSESGQARGPRRRRRRAKVTPPPLDAGQSVSPTLSPMSIHLRHSLSAMNLSGVIDDLELSLQYGSRGSEFGNLTLTYVGLATFVKRIGGVLERTLDPVSGLCTLDVEVRCALVLYFSLHAVETSRFRDEFKSACEQNVRLLDVAFNRQLAGTLLNAAAYVSSVPIVREDALVMYANNSSLDKNTTFSLSNAPVLSYDQLDQFESYYGRTVWPKPLPPKDAVLVNARPILSPVLFMCD
ncbi:hypothetical protein GGF32_006100 [Allomyces javanicus]|nr:hypothetical protein GGF32_006100 [Allomyces javanicus]